MINRQGKLCYQFDFVYFYIQSISLASHNMDHTIEQKQNYLRSQILQKGLDPQAFMLYMGTVKNQGQNINLQNWTIDQVKQVVNDFRLILERQAKKESQKFDFQASRGSKQMMTSKIMESIEKKTKVFYDSNDLWDYEIHSSQECKKLGTYFEFKVSPEIDYKSWDIKKTGGFIFGIGATNQLQITFITNFTSQTITRKSQDIDWLRQRLCGKYPGSFIPPFEAIRAVQPEDKTGIMKHVKQAIFFLNSLLGYDYLVQNKYFHAFLTEIDHAKFTNFKTKEDAVKMPSDIGSIETVQGNFKVQISQRVLNFVKQSSSYGQAADDIYRNIQTNIRKVMGDLQTLAKHSHYIANDFAKLHEKHNKMVDKCEIKGSNNTKQQLSNIFIYMNNLFTTLGNEKKKTLATLRQFSEEFTRYTHDEWKQFLIHHKKYQNQMGNYLSLKHNLLKKKQRNLGDISKWDLDDRQRFRMSRVNTQKMDKQDAFEIMYPKQNKAEEEMRIWQAFINYRYEKSYRILIESQEKMYVKHCGKFCKKMENLVQQQIELYHKFYDIFQQRG